MEGLRRVSEHERAARSAEEAAPTLSPALLRAIREEVERALAALRSRADGGADRASADDLGPR
jgi:hypothetical protein